MSKLKAALLDDNKEQLLINQQMLERSGAVSVVTACNSSEAFLASIKITQPEVLFLDLNLGDPLARNCIPCPLLLACSIFLLTTFK